ncbi:MAG: hypothetical protein ACR2IP_13480 [Solirubrobacteraceae bacterium]
MPGTAQATYPGANGLLAYEVVRLGSMFSDQIDVLAPGARQKSATIAYCGKPSETLAVNYSAPAFSPDGRKVAFSQLNAGQCAPPTCCFQRISIANADGSGAHALAALTATARRSSWPPARGWCSLADRIATRRTTCTRSRPAVATFAA